MTYTEGNNNLHRGEQRPRLRGTTAYMKRNNDLHGEEQRPRLRRTTTYTERKKRNEIKNENIKRKIIIINVGNNKIK
jgi:hypothetical protein